MLLSNNGRNGSLSTLSPGIKRALEGLTASRFIKPDATINRFVSFKELTSTKGLADKLYGPIKAGYVNDSEVTFGLNLQDSPKNLLVLGSPGTGKTNICRVLIDGFLKNTTATIVYFDKKGTEKSLYNYLCQILGKEQFLFLSPEKNLCENPFSSPHPKILAQQWYRMICNVLLPALDIRFESGNALIAAVEKAKRDLGNGSDPCLFDTYPCLVALRPKRYDERIKADYYARAEFRIEMCLINLPNVFSYRKGLPFEEYRKMRFILIDLSQTDDFSSKMIVESLVAKIVNYQLAESNETDLSWVLFFDEAESYYAYNRINTFAGLSPLESYIRMTRSTGIWQVLANQSYSSLSLGARTMAGCKILFKVDPTELRHVQESMNLQKEELDIVNSLQTGQALVRLDSRPGLPVFKLSVPEFKVLHANNGDGIFEPITQRFNCEPIPEDQKRNVLNMIFGEQHKRKENETPTTEKNKQTQQSDNIKVIELLSNIAAIPFVMFSERLKELKFNGSIAEADRIKKLLIEKDYVIEYRIKLRKGRGSPASYLELSDQGKEFLSQNGNTKSRRYQGKSGFLHALIIYRLIKPFYDEKFETIIEGKNQGSDCDLCVYAPGGKIAVEVSYTTSPDDELRNLSRNLSAGYDTVQIITVGTSTEGKTIVEDEETAHRKKEDLQEAIAKEFDGVTRQRIQVLTLKEFRDMT